MIEPDISSNTLSPTKQLKANYTLLIHDFDVLYIFLSTVCTRTNFNHIGACVQTRISILFEYHPLLGKILILQYQLLFERWLLINQAVYGAQRTFSHSKNTQP
jgi:hypothetical protein